MKWFQHDSDATQDAKVKKLLIKYGVTGYAIYFHCIELITSDISETNLTFELEHDSEIIADNLKISGDANKSGIAIVEEIMNYIVDLKLFENIGGKIFCFKLLKRLNTSQTSNKRFREMITVAKESHDTVMTQSCYKRREEKRIEDKTTEDKTEEDQAPISHLISESINHWNLGTLPKCRYTVMTLPNINIVSSRIAVFSLEEVKKAIDNLRKFWTKEDPKFRPASFQNFIERSIERWTDEAKPWERYDEDPDKLPPLKTSPLLKDLP